MYYVGTQYMFVLIKSDLNWAKKRSAGENTLLRILQVKLFFQKQFGEGWGEFLAFCSNFTTPLIFSSPSFRPPSISTIARRRVSNSANKTIHVSHGNSVQIFQRTSTRFSRHCIRVCVCLFRRLVNDRLLLIRCGFIFIFRGKLGCGKSRVSAGKAELILWGN